MQTHNTTIHIDPCRPPLPRALSGSGEDGRLVLTVAEAAELLGISRALAYELVARGELPSIRLGRRIVVPRVKLAALVVGPD
jgi:excisionase family DNA binding protein